MKPPKLKAFATAKLPFTMWKNGGGMTREIVCQPPGADAFDWRVSIAHIAKDGPFSAFPGIDRVITLLEGGGVRLRSKDGTIDHKLENPLQPFAFAGEAVIDSSLLLGACDDFNVMTRRDTWRAEVSIFRQAVTLPASQGGVVLALRGDWRVAQEAVRPRAGVWWQGKTAGLSLESRSAHGILLAVTFHERVA
jgi:environmental stress-induced protein Ves